MSILKKFKGAYTYEDLFDTQAALDSGALDKVETGSTTTDTYKRDSIFTGYRQTDSKTTPNYSDKNNLGSILGQTDAIAANRKRRLEQQGAKSAGLGQSILGGGSF